MSAEVKLALPERRNLIAAEASNEAGDCFEKEFHNRRFVCARRKARLIGQKLSDPRTNVLEKHLRTALHLFLCRV